MKDKNNFTDKRISEFNETDTFYMQKMQGGYVHTFLLKFKSFSKSMVIGEILDIQPNNVKSIWLGKEYLVFGSDLSGRLSKCYTFEKGRGCRWFKKDGNDWRCH